MISHCQSRHQCRFHESSINNMFHFRKYIPILRSPDAHTRAHISNVDLEIVWTNTLSIQSACTHGLSAFIACPPRDLDLSHTHTNAWAPRANCGRMSWTECVRVSACSFGHWPDRTYYPCYKARFAAPHKCRLIDFYWPSNILLSGRGK